MRAHALFSSNLRFSRALLFVGLILFSVAGARDAAAEIIVQNGSNPPTGGIQIPTFVGERFGALLTSPVAGTIVGVQISWGSANGGAAPSQETAIRISAADGTMFGGVNPAPGTVWATINAPVLIDGGANEFRFLDPSTNLLPLGVPIVAGQNFFVDLETATTLTGTGAASPGIYYDARPAGLPRDAIHRDQSAPIGNMFYWDPAIASNSPPAFADFGIRVIIQPVPEPSTYALVAIGAVALLAVRRRKAVA